MDWLEITVDTAPDGIELLAAYLGECGYDSLTVSDESEFRDFLEETKPSWDYVDAELEKQMQGACYLRYYCKAETREAELQKLKEALKNARLLFPAASFGTLAIHTRICRNEDWENCWKEFYQPIPIGKRLLILPEWLSAEDTQGRTPVLLDPGLIFGTGQHASTQMCLSCLESIVRGGESVLDLGSGSGILSIAALKLGAASALAVDIDPKAEDVARHNAAQNGLEKDCFKAVTGNVLEDQGMLTGSYDIVIANIVADVILALSGSVRQFLKEGGRFLCSGIIDTREQEVSDALLKAGLEIETKYAQDGWRCFLCREKRNED